MAVIRLRLLLLRRESACAPPTSGSLVTAQAVTLLWWIDGVFAAPSGGRSIRSNCSTLWTSGSSAALSGGSPNLLGLPCRRVLFDNGSSYRSGEWRKAHSALDSSPSAHGSTPPERTPRPSDSSSRSIFCEAVDPAGENWRMGVCHAVPDLRGTEPISSALSRVL